jgi:hypothetical protein
MNEQPTIWTFFLAFSQAKGEANHSSPKASFS